MGAKLGAHLDRFYEGQPKAADNRCNTCAFRKGTFPNQCLATVADALKCALEHVDFHCHERPGLCAGYEVMKSSKPISAPWPFAMSDEAEEQLDSLGLLKKPKGESQP